MDPIDYQISHTLDEEIFSFPIEDKKHPESIRYLLKSWNYYSNYKDRAFSNFSEHVAAFAIYWIPLFGDAMKLLEVTYFSKGLLIPGKNPISSPREFFETLQGRVAELDVNDTIYLLAKLTQIATCALLGITFSPISVYILFFWFILGSLCFRDLFAHDILNSHFQMAQKVDLALCFQLLKKARDVLPYHDSQREVAKAGFIQLHNFFRYKSEDVQEKAKKILESGWLDSLYDVFVQHPTEQDIVRLLKKRIEILKDLY